MHHGWLLWERYQTESSLLKMIAFKSFSIWHPPFSVLRTFFFICIIIGLMGSAACSVSRGTASWMEGHLAQEYWGAVSRVSLPLQIQIVKVTLDWQNTVLLFLPNTSAEITLITTGYLQTDKMCRVFVVFAIWFRFCAALRWAAD